MCSITTYNYGHNFKILGMTLLRNCDSRSNISTLESVTSPCVSKGRLHSDMVRKVGKSFSILVTPLSEFVVAPLGYNLTAYTYIYV